MRDEKQTTHKERARQTAVASSGYDSDSEFALRKWAVCEEEAAAAAASLLIRPVGRVHIESNKN